VKPRNYQTTALGYERAIQKATQITSALMILTLARVEQLRVVYGQPIDVSDLGELDPRDAAQPATDRLMAEIRRLYETL